MMLRFGAFLAASLALAAPLAAHDLLAGESATDIPAIAGVVSGDAEWELVIADFLIADGMATLPDGGLLFAQEQSNTVKKILPDGTQHIYLGDIAGAGAVSVDGEGNVYAVERTCTDPGLNFPSCPELTRVVQIAPTRRLIANAFADGTSLGRLNDLQADGHGGAWFTQGALYHTTADGTVTTVAQVDAFTNGVTLSPDGKTLYVTNRTEILAFDVGANGATSNRRTFATLSSDTAGFGGDGMTVDAQGRLYVTGDAGVYVFAADGRELGIMPTPRRSITLAFAGPERDMLYIGTMGAVGPDGKLWATPDGVRNVAMTIYRVPTLARGMR
ncbi:hypothetical protein GCM10009127_24790 [Alteraurantiacibacter aestuarii]|uniref:SMP-30/gluconolactonase/LRE family protein n=1 Tax=Alteraurantiacibacter aestuarii TaxID=650004 RepID=UPI0031E468FD